MSRRGNVVLWIAGIVTLAVSQIELPSLKPFSVALAGVAGAILTVVDKSALMPKPRKTPTEPQKAVGE